MQPLFLSLDELLLLHKDLIETYGGSHGVRDQGLLESALAQPEAGFGGQYLCKDIYEMAAADLYHLVQNHPFHDGNKRIGAQAANVFLALNGLDIQASCETEFTELVLSVASGKTQKPEIADFFRKNCVLL